MKPTELRDRTRRFSVAVIKLVEKLPRNHAGSAGGAIAEPLVKAGIAVGLKYRLTCRAPSPYDFLHRIGECEDAADECTHWIDLIHEADLLPADATEPVRDEARKLKRIFTKSRRAAAKRQRESTYREGMRGDDDIPF